MGYQEKVGRIAVALDIGTTKVCAIAGRLNQYGKIEILGMGRVRSEGVSRGVVSNIDKTVRAISEAVDMAQQASGLTFTDVYVGIAGKHIKSLHHHGLLVRHNSNDEINQEDVNRLIKDMYKLVLPPGDTILHVIPQEYTVDDEQGIADPIGMSGVRLEANFHIITGQDSASNNIERCVTKSGLHTSKIMLEPMASSESVLTVEEKEAGVVLVDIGGGTTDITIFKEDVIRHTCVIPFGGNVITKDIQEGCVVLHDQAEKLKQRFGAALAEEIYDNKIITVPGFKGREPKEVSERNLAYIIQARIEEIFDYIMWEIRRSGYENKLFAGIVLTGGGSLLKFIDLLSEEHTGMATRIGMPVDHLAHGYSKDLASPIFATAVGLLKKAIGEVEEDMAYVEGQEPAKPEIVIDDTIEEDAVTTEQTEEEDENGGQPKAKGEKGKSWVDRFYDFFNDLLDPSPDSDF